VIEANKTSKNWLPRQRPLRDRNIDNRPFIGSHSSTNPANLVKIGPVDVEIVSLTEIGKNKYETRAEWSGVRPSVGLSHRSTTATAAGRFAAERQRLQQISIYSCGRRSAGTRNKCG